MNMVRFHATSYVRPFDNILDDDDDDDDEGGRDTATQSKPAIHYFSYLKPPSTTLQCETILYIIFQYIQTYYELGPPTCSDVYYFY
jgi:hypothetical protein